jgi:hypothetical protein
MKWMLAILAVVSLIALPLWGLAQQGKTPAPTATPGMPDQSEQSPGTGGGMVHHHMMGEEHQMMMMEKCKGMAANFDKMDQEFKAMDAALSQKIAAMEAARGDQKIDAMASVISEMASQRKEMHEKMATLQRDRMMCMTMDKGGDAKDHGGHGMMGGMGGCNTMKEHMGGGMGHQEGAQPQSGTKPGEPGAGGGRI